jgi:hypothetical protein
MAAREDSVVKGVADAWDFYLDQYPITVPACIEQAVQNAVQEWLGDHTTELISAIAEAIARNAEYEASEMKTPPTQ